MDGLIQPSPLASEPDRIGRAIVIAIAVIVVGAGVAALLLREQPRMKPAPPAYAASLKFGDLKMSQAQNFVGATVTYVDGTLSNLGDKTLTHAVVQVTFRDSYGQVAQIENVTLRALRTGGPYDDTADLNASPLTPGQNTRFRLTFEHVSEQWNQGYPEMQITELSTK